MTDEARSNRSRPLLALGAVVVVVVVGLSLPAGRTLVGRFFRSLRMQKVQAVNVDLSSFTDPNANPALHQMVAQMISDKVVVTVNEQDKPASDASAATQLAGFPVKLLGSRKDPPKLVVSGAHAINLTVDRSRLQAIFTEAGHPDLVVPQSLDGAAVAIQHLAEIGLEVAGMNSTQSHDFLQTVDWKSTLSMTVPRFLRSYQALKVNGAQGTLLTLAGRRGPGYTLIWVKNGIAYSLVGFGDSSQPVDLPTPLK